jgi:hypothetical protein
MGNAEINTILSGISLERYFGSSSPKIRSINVEIIRIVISLKPKIRARNKAEREAKEMLTILLPINIIEKNFCGLLVK